MKRIAIIVPGGIGTGPFNIGVPTMEQLVIALSKKFHVTVFSLFKINEGYRAEGFQMVVIDAVSRTGKTIRFLRAFRKLHRQKKFDVVHGFWTLPSGLLAVIAGKLFKVKSLVSLLGGDANAVPEISYGELLRPVSKRAIFWTLRQADVVISVSQFMVDNLYKHGLPKRRVNVIPWGVDSSRIQYHDHVVDSPVRFLHIGNLNLVKDQRTLLRTFQLIHREVPSSLRIIGEGDQLKALQDLCAELNIAEYVTIEPPIPHDQLSRVYQGSDILLQTSLSEGQGMAVTEAMAAGVLVGSTRVGIVADLPGKTISVRPGDFEALADAIIKVLHDKNEMQKIIDQARRWSDQHGFYFTVDEIRKIYLKE